MEEQLVVFQLAGETYGLDINCVQEIIRLQEVTRVPRTPDFVEGVINLRGRIIPVVDMRKRFSLPAGDQTANSRIMVVEMGPVTVGFIVDAVTEVLRLSEEDIEPPPSIMGGIDTAYLRGVGKRQDRLIILLDVGKVLEEKEYQQLARAQDSLGTAI